MSVDKAPRLPYMELTSGNLIDLFDQTVDDLSQTHST
jgi:hypothetical protein